MESLRFDAMGTDIQVLMDAEEETAWLAFLEVPVWFEQWEQHLSRFRLGSELSKINNSPGQNIQVSPVFAEVMDLALHTEKISQGLITPAILPSLINAGYDRSFELIPEFRNQENLAKPHFPISTEGLCWNAKTREINVPEGMQLDFGGVAKGWAAHQAAQQLASYGPVLVNAGGDIATAGMPIDSMNWQVGIRDPFTREIDFAVIDIHQGGMATSGIDRRHWRQNGVFRHHLIDPQTGESAVSDLLQVTIIAEDVIQAEMAAKMVFFKGSQEGLAWLTKNPQYEGVLIDKQGRIYQTEHLSLNVFEELKV
jgi:FAD:protein FMN transferase